MSSLYQEIHKDMVKVVSDVVKVVTAQVHPHLSLSSRYGVQVTLEHSHSLSLCRILQGSQNIFSLHHCNVKQLTQYYSSFTTSVAKA